MRMLLLTLMVVGLIGCSDNKPTDQIWYLRSHDGWRNMYIRLDANGEGRMDSLSDSDELNVFAKGTDLVRCDRPGIKCFKDQGMIVAVACDIEHKSKWSVDGHDFVVTRSFYRNHEQVWLVNGMQGGDTFFHYSFTEANGVETISFQPTVDEPRLVRTYFVAGKTGLLKCP